jgi:hypothetical protein
MARARGASHVAQAWIEALADDPEATSALEVARARLPGGRALRGLRRLRVFELRGALPDRAALAELLHRSIQFYNPAKERCTLRLDPLEAAPLAADEAGVLVLERGSERRPAAERWWMHETGTPAEIREGVAWALRLAAGADPGRAAADLAILRDRGHGLLCNPHWQDARVAAAEVPLPWIAPGSPEEHDANSRSGTPGKRPATARRVAASGSAAPVRRPPAARPRKGVKARSARRPVR